MHQTRRNLLNQRLSPMHHPRRHLLHSLPRHLGNVNLLAINVVPRAAEEKRNVMREVEACGDEGEADEEEDDGACEVES